MKIIHRYHEDGSYIVSEQAKEFYNIIGAVASKYGWMNFTSPLWRCYREPEELRPWLCRSSPA
jgi:hypothetical protein